MSSPMSKKRKLDVKSIEDKYKAIQQVESGLMTKAAIAESYGIPRNTLSTWIKNKDKIIEAYESSSFTPASKKMWHAEYPDVENADKSLVELANIETANTQSKQKTLNDFFNVH